MTVQTVMGRATHGFAGHVCSMMKSACFRSLGQTGTVPAVQETVILYTKSKKISNDQELIQSDPTSCPINRKGNN